MSHKRVVNIHIGSALYRGLQKALNRENQLFTYDGHTYVIYDIKPFKTGWISVYLILKGFENDS